MEPIASQALPSATIAPGCAKTLGAKVKALGGKTAFVVTDPGVSGAGITAIVVGYLEAAGVGCVVFDKVAANPTMSVVAAGIKVLRDEIGLEGVVVVSLGGGSSMDAAKAIAVIAPDGGGEDVAAYCMQPALSEGTDNINMMSMMPSAVPSARALPIIALPTTSGTASETNGGAVLTTTTESGGHRKLIFANEGGLHDRLHNACSALPPPPPPVAHPRRERVHDDTARREQAGWQPRRCWTLSLRSSCQPTRPPPAGWTCLPTPWRCGIAPMRQFTRRCHTCAPAHQIATALVDVPMAWRGERHRQTARPHQTRERCRPCAMR